MPAIQVSVLAAFFETGSLKRLDAVGDRLDTGHRRTAGREGAHEAGRA